MHEAFAEDESEGRQTKSKQEIPGPVRSTKLQTGGQEIERDQKQHLRPGKMRRRRNARPGCAEKADDEGGHETLDHQARMQNGGILDNTRVVEWPERDPKHGEERPDREKMKKRLLVKQVRGRSAFCIF